VFAPTIEAILDATHERLLGALSARCRTVPADRGKLGPLWREDCPHGGRRHECETDDSQRDDVEDHTDEDDAETDNHSHGTDCDTPALTRPLGHRATQFGVGTEVALKLLKHSLLVFRQRHCDLLYASMCSQSNSEVAHGLAEASACSIDSTRHSVRDVPEKRIEATNDRTAASTRETAALKVDSGYRARTCSA